MTQEHHADDASSRPLGMLASVASARRTGPPGPGMAPIHPWPAGYPAQRVRPIRTQPSPAGMARGRRWQGLLLSLCVTGCQWPQASLQPGPLATDRGTIVVTGRALFAGPQVRARQVQFLASQLAAVHLAITELATGVTTTHDYIRPDLPGTDGRRTPFSFAVLDLPAGPYQATLTAYADPAETEAVGTATSSPFTVAAGATVDISMPPLALAPTPVGSWTVATTVTSKLSEFRIIGYTYRVVETAGTTASRYVATSRTAITHTWGDLVAFPAGISTVSITVTARDERSPAPLSKTVVATGTVAPGATISTKVALAL